MTAGVYALAALRRERDRLRLFAESITADDTPGAVRTLVTSAVQDLEDAILLLERQ